MSSATVTPSKEEELTNEDNDTTADGSGYVTPPKEEEEFLTNDDNTTDAPPLSTTNLFQSTVLDQLSQITSDMKKCADDVVEYGERIQNLEESNNARSNLLMNANLDKFKDLEANNDQLSVRTDSIVEATIATFNEEEENNEKYSMVEVAVKERSKKEEAVAIAEAMYVFRSNSQKMNLQHVHDVMREHSGFFLLILEINPTFDVMLSHIMENKFGFSVRSIPHNRKIGDWNEEDAMHVGVSLATFIRKRKTGDSGLDAWRRHYSQVNELFDSVGGFEDFMLVFANNLLRDR